MGYNPIGKRLSKVEQDILQVGVIDGSAHGHTGGKGASITESALSFSDNTEKNASSEKHGLLQKYPGDDTLFLRGDGVWGEAQKGDKGDQGEQGIQGPAGSQGPKGDIGQGGPMGLQGATGPSGPTGEAGPQGEQGPAGADGAQGEDGAQGPAGEPGTIVAVSDTPPSTPDTNDLWVDTDGEAPPRVTVGSTPPSNPEVDELWIDTEP